MKNYFIAFLFVLSSLALKAQDNITEELKNLSDSEQYDKIISEHAPKSKDYPAKALYYIGFAYYMKEDDKNCVMYMDRVIEKDAGFASPHYIRAFTFYYAGKYEEAIKGFQKTISIKPDDAESYSGIGDCYYKQEKLDQAINAYKKAIELPNCPDRPYSMIAQAYDDQKNYEKALEYYYLAKSKVNRESDSYLNALYNIGLKEFLKGNYDKAESALLELLQLDPKDYQASAKLIQIYYHNKDYAKAKPYRDKLYQAYKNNQLNGNIKDRFCFDQFNWNDKLIQAFERYEEPPKDDVFDKHIFYVLNQNDEIDIKIKTEYSPISVELGGPTYLLCSQKGSVHTTYNIGYKDKPDYDDLKKKVIEVLEGKHRPSASSRPSK